MNQCLQNHCVVLWQEYVLEVLEDIEGGDYVLNELEVWGGDCILDVFAFPRVLPAFEYEEGKIDYVGQGKDKEETPTKTSFIAYKQHFFSSVLLP